MVLELELVVAGVDGGLGVAAEVFAAVEFVGVESVKCCESVVRAILTVVYLSVGYFLDGVGEDTHWSSILFDWGVSVGHAEHF